MVYIAIYSETQGNYPMTVDIRVFKLMDILAELSFGEGK